MAFILTAACLTFTACAESSYEIAVKNGFTGSETEWLNSLHGEKGEKGETGEKGDSGEAGRNGTDGSDGTVWYSGNGTPASALGKTGDYYLDFTDGSVYEKTSSGWTKRGELKAEAPKDGSDEDSGGTPEGGDGSELKETVTIVFDEGNGIRQEQKITKGESLDLPIPVREGYVFLGWFYGTGVNAGQANDLTSFTRDITLTAKWREKYTMTAYGSESTDAKIGKYLSLTAAYNGTSNAEYKLYVEKDGSRRDLEDAEEWVSGSSFNVEAGQDCYMLYCSLVFKEAGEYRVIFSATEDGDRAEVIFEVTVA